MKKDVVNNISKEICTGCCVCENVCPQNAIHMEKDNEGFIFPTVDYQKCTDCGLCVKRCPLTEPQYTNDKNPECRAIWAKDEIRLTSASGGIFSAYAEIILEQGGVICGAAYNEDFSVSHLCADNIEGLNKIKSSKYIQSNVGLVYREVKDYLKKGRKVLFSGCPCQVAGLYSYLGKNKISNLYTMDVICHGIPSAKVLRKYIIEKVGNKKIKQIEFRNKDYFGWSSSIVVTAEDGTIYKNAHRQDSFYKAFLNSLSVRKSCANCKFSCLPRQGDITIGDFWGISRFDKTLNDGKGTSLVLINNKKGLQIINECKKMFSRDVIMPLENGVAGNRAIIKPFKAHPARRRFFENLDKTELDKLVNDCLTHHYDVGIIGLWYGLNYGSILTYYALNRVISDMGYQCIMVNKPKELWDKRFEDRNSVANKFIYNNCYVSNIRKNAEDWAELNNHCDTFIVGSDVVWNYDVCGRQTGHFFYLDFIKNSKKKLAYASSFGGGINNDYEYESLSKYYLSKFDDISVREDEAVKLFDERYRISVEQVLDPVFLCNKQHYEQRISESKVQEHQPYLCTYFLGPNKIKKNIILKLCEIRGLEYKNLYNPNVNIDLLEERLGLSLLRDVSVEDWLYYIKNCDFFIGDSFHGLCFSIIFEKPFIIVIDRNLPSRNRFDSLLRMLGLESRLTYLDTPIEEILQIVSQPINYTEVKEKMSPYRDKSYNWLKNALSRKKKMLCKPEDFIIENLCERINSLEAKISEK